MMNGHEPVPPKPGSRPPDPGPGEPGRSGSDGPEPSLPLTDVDPDVGLSQKGSGEDAILRRETEI
ncbi:hypothetical protein ACU4GR_17190 [Methylobacterium oryzae CBMB20]